MNRFDIPVTVKNILDKALEIELIDTAEIVALGGRFGMDFNGMVDAIVYYAYCNIHVNNDHNIIAPLADDHYASCRPAAEPVVEEAIVEEDEPDFDTAFFSFFQGCAEINHISSRLHFPNNPISEFSFKKGRRYMKVVRDTSVHCFVDIQNGDVLKAASWNAPAKHARGNIFDDNNGLGSMGDYGPAYLR